MRPMRRFRRPQATTGGDVRVLTPADISRVRADRHPKLRPGDAEALVIQEPGLSFWHPETDEFVLVTPWRHRADIPGVHLLSSFHHEDALLSAAIHAAHAKGKRAFVVMDAFETRRSSFYDRNRLAELEEIVTYEHCAPQLLVRDDVQTSLVWMRVIVLDDVSLDALITIDTASFPWLWQNSVEEFRAYFAMPFVEIWLGFLDDVPAAYLGLTHFRRWSHLDRIAVTPAWQGRGLGREALSFAASRMIDHGAEKMALSTQSSNTVSRAMYSSAGFVETPSMNYAVHGVIFDQSAHDDSEHGEPDV